MVAQGVRVTAEGEQDWQQNVGRDRRVLLRSQEVRLYDGQGITSGDGCFQLFDASDDMPRVASGFRSNGRRTEDRCTAAWKNEIRICAEDRHQRGALAIVPALLTHRWSKGHVDMRKENRCVLSSRDMETSSEA